MLSIRHDGAAPERKPGPVTATFSGDGVYRDHAALAPTDPVNHWQRGPTREYHVRLEADQSYVIDLRSHALDPYLRLTDAEDRMLSEDDDNGGSKNAHLHFRPRVDGLYRIHASGRPGELGAFTLSIRRQSARAPTPAPPDELTTRLLPLVVSGTYHACRDMAGKAIYLLNDRGRLQRYDLALDNVSHSAQLPRGTNGLSFCRHGLLVSSERQAYLLDPTTLQTRQTYQLPFEGRLLSAPGLTVAFVERPAKRRNVLGIVDIFDLEGGALVDSRAIGWTPALTPDGQHLFVQGGMSGGSLVRYRVVGNTLKLEEEGPTISRVPARQIVLSTDGKYVCLFAPTGNLRGVAGHRAAAGKVCLYVYAADNLKQPAFSLVSGRVLHAVAIDAVAERMFCVDDQRRLSRFDLTGTLQQTAILPFPCLKLQADPFQPGGPLLGGNDTELHLIAP